MIIYFADRHMNILGSASTGLPKGLVIDNDTCTDDLDSGVMTLEFDFQYQREQIKGESFTEPGNYLLQDDDGQQAWYTILTSETDTEKNRISVYAESAGLDLINEIADAYTAEEAHPASFYVEKFAYDSGFEIGINEISNLSRKLSWESESTVTERLLSIATEFDAEISFSFDIDRLVVKHKYINLLQKRGNDFGVQLRLGKEVKNIIKKKSIENVATALKVTGGTPEGSEDPITLHGYAYDDGDFFVEGTYLKSREAWKRWSRYLAESGSYTGHIGRSFTYDTTSQSELCNRAISELKRCREMQVNYDIELYELPPNVHIGDRVSIIDNAGQLYLSSRVLKLEKSVSKRTQTVTLGEHVLRENGVDLHAMSYAMEQLSSSTRKQIAQTQQIANTKNTIYHTSQPPDGEHTIDDIWMDISNGNQMYYWNGNEWEIGLFGGGALDMDDVFARNIMASGTITGATLKGSSGEFTKSFNVQVPVDDTDNFYIRADPNTVAIGLQSSGGMGDHGGSLSFSQDHVTLASSRQMNISGRSGVNISTGAGELSINNQLLLDIIYPVGSIYETTDGKFQPSNYWGGTWERIKDKFLLAAGDIYQGGSTGGEAEHILIVNELPAHAHTSYISNGAGDTTWHPDTGSNAKDTSGLVTASGGVKTFGASLAMDNAGGGVAHNNMPPYMVVYVWKRTE